MTRSFTAHAHDGAIVADVNASTDGSPGNVDDDVTADIMTDPSAPMAAELLDAEWSAEIERRAARALAEPDGGTPWADVEARLRARLGSW